MPFHIVAANIWNNSWEKLINSGLNIEFHNWKVPNILIRFNSSTYFDLYYLVNDKNTSSVNLLKSVKTVYWKMLFGLINIKFIR